MNVTLDLNFPYSLFVLNTREAEGEESRKKGIIKSWKRKGRTKQGRKGKEERKRETENIKRKDWKKINQSKTKRKGKEKKNRKKEKDEGRRESE